MTAKKPTTAEAILMVAQAVRELKDSKQDKQAFEALKTQVKEFLQNVITREEVQRMIAEAELDDLTLEQVQERILAAVADKAATQAVNDKNAEQDEKIRELERLVGILEEKAEFTQAPQNISDEFFASFIEQQHQYQERLMQQELERAEQERAEQERQDTEYLTPIIAEAGRRINEYLADHQGVIGYDNIQGYNSNQHLVMQEDILTALNNDYTDVSWYMSKNVERDTMTVTLYASKNHASLSHTLQATRQYYNEIVGLYVADGYQPKFDNLAAPLKQWDMTGDTAVHDDGVQIGKNATLSTTIDTIPNQRYLLAFRKNDEAVPGFMGITVDNARSAKWLDRTIITHEFTAMTTKTSIIMDADETIKLHNAVVIAI